MATVSDSSWEDFSSGLVNLLDICKNYSLNVNLDFPSAAILFNFVWTSRYQFSEVFLTVVSRSDTVMSYFEDASWQNGLPSRVRGDHGGENVLVAQFIMTHEKGEGRGRSSTRNQRIEHLSGFPKVPAQFQTLAFPLHS